MNEILYGEKLRNFSRSRTWSFLWSLDEKAREKCAEHFRKRNPEALASMMQFFISILGFSEALLFLGFEKQI